MKQALNANLTKQTLSQKRLQKNNNLNKSNQIDKTCQK
jgi:hypothetical protein